MGKNVFAPLPSSTLLIAIIGFFVSVIYFMKRWPSFGFSFALIFTILFIASMLSLTYAPERDLLLMEQYERNHTGGQLKESKTEKKVLKWINFIFAKDKKKSKKK